MAKPSVTEFLARLEGELGGLRRVGDGRSLFRAPSVDTLFYIRYSKIHAGNIPWAFFGLRLEDVARLRGTNAFLCFVTDSREEVYLLPFARFEHILREDDASGGQFKVNFHYRRGGVQASFAKRGNYSVDAYRGLSGLSVLRGVPHSTAPADITHEGMQSLLGGIGARRGFDLWFPRNDIGKIRSDIIASGRVRDRLPAIGGKVDKIMQNIDVIWLDGATLVSFFEVEHTSQIYSGLLRFCDVFLTYAKLNDFRIVSRVVRENKFNEELDRPTFREHKLGERVTFMSYDNAWSLREDLGIEWGLE